MIMAEVGDKLVDLKSLKVVGEAIVNEVIRMINEVVADMQNGKVDVVRQSTHHTDYTRDTLEFVTDSTGKVTNVYFMSK